MCNYTFRTYDECDHVRLLFYKHCVNKRLLHHCNLVRIFEEDVVNYKYLFCRGRRPFSFLNVHDTENQYCTRWNEQVEKQREWRMLHPELVNAVTPIKEAAEKTMKERIKEWMHRLVRGKEEKVTVKPRRSLYNPGPVQWRTPAEIQEVDRRRRLVKMRILGFFFKWWYGFDEQDELEPLLRTGVEPHPLPPRTPRRALVVMEDKSSSV